MLLLILILVIVLGGGAFPVYNRYGPAYGGGLGIVGLILLIVLIVFLFRGGYGWGF